MPRPPNYDLPDHPAIAGPAYLGRMYGVSKVVALVRCPRCRKTREIEATVIRRDVAQNNFKGYCRDCSIASVKDGTHRWRNQRASIKGKHKGGYVLVAAKDVPDDLLPMFRQMQRSGQPVLEHRWEMAKFLGRALTSRELVDHEDGNKTNNVASADPMTNNLRLYVRGKQKPGSAPGHGRFYHEWQMAERRAQTAETLLAFLLLYGPVAISPRVTVPASSETAAT